MMSSSMSSLSSRASVRGGSRAKRGGVVAKKGSKRSGLRSGDWRHGGRLVIKSKSSRTKRGTEKTRTRSGDFEARVDVEESHGGE